MHRKDGLSPTHEMYLKVLFRASQEHGIARVRDMAKGLGVNASTVSAVLKKLEHSGLVRHDHYGHVTLTAIGLDVAECVVRRFETIKALLTDVLGLDLETAEVDACMLEHGVSPATVNRMERLVRLVRIGGVDLSRFIADTTGHELQRCCDCEAGGACRAEVALQAHGSVHE